MDNFMDLPVMSAAELLSINDDWVQIQANTGPRRLSLQDFISQAITPRQVSRLVRVGLFGDSTANPGSSQVSPDSHDVSIHTAPFPGSATTTSLALSGSKFLLGTQYQRCHLVFNGGVSGDSTTAMLARDDAGASTTRKAILDMQGANIDVCIFRGGSINDVTAGSAENTILAQHIKLLNRMMTAGDYMIIDEGIAGYSVTGGSTDLYRQRLISLNAQFKAFAAKYPNRIIFLDPVGLTCNGDGTFITGRCRSDNLHLSFYGQMCLAQAEAAILTRLFGPAIGPRFPGVNLLSNPLLTTVTSPGYGSVGTNWAIQVTNGTRQNAAVEQIDGKLWQTVEIVSNGAGGGGSILAPYTPNSAGYGIIRGDIVGVEFDWFFEGATPNSTPPLPTAIVARFDNTQTGTSGRVVLQHLIPDENTAFPSDAGRMKGHVLLGPFQFQDASANMTSISNITLNFKTDAATTFKMGMSSPRLVKIDNGYEGLNEEVRGVLASGSAVSLSSGVGKTITSITLGIGSWDVSGVVDSVLAASSATIFNGSISSVTDTLSANQDETTTDLVALTTVTGTKRQVTPTVRLHLFAPTTIYLVASNTFSAGTQTAYGTITASRVFGRRLTT